MRGQSKAAGARAASWLYRRQRAGALALSGLALSSVIGVGAVIGSGTADAAIDGHASIVDYVGDHLDTYLADTRIDFYPALDDSPSTREWFLNGTMGYKITGPQAGGFKGTIGFGYQVGFPGTVNGTIDASWTSPSLTYNSNTTSTTNGTTTSQSSPFTLQAQVIPQATGRLQVGMGPGIVDIPVASANIGGSNGVVRIQGFHGTVRGVLGRTNIRLYVKLVSDHGDTVIAYSKVFSN